MAASHMTDLNDSLDDLFDGPKLTGDALAAKVEHVRAVDDAVGYTEACRKCGGTGRFKAFGQCFACKGAGKLRFKTSPADRAAGRDSKARSAEAKADAAWALFTTDHPDRAAWIDARPQNPFAISLKEGVIKYGHLTERQGLAVDRMIAEDAERAAGDARRVAEAMPVNIAGIEAAFAKASARLKRPKLRLAGFTISHAGASSRNAGSLYVKADGDVYLGKITGGRFITSRECTPEFEGRFRMVADDPLKAAIEYGRLTGNCAVCNRSLTADDSVARGIGPVCAENFGWA